MADAIVSLALRTLRDLLLEETKFLYGVSSEVKGLESKLKEMQCLLNDANTRQHESSSVRNWIAEVRDLAYRAEDVIETYAIEISSNKGKGFRKLFRRFSCVLNKGFVVVLHQIGSEILDIKSEIDLVHKSMQAFGIKEIIQGESSVSSASKENEQWKRQTYPVEIEDCFVGKEEDLNRLVSLIAEEKQHRIISIWGMGGIGKTTIARKVYNHFKSGGPFTCFAWVCITQQCQIRSVLEDVLKQLIPQQRADIINFSNAELVQFLCEVQEAKRCLIVLDDLWQIHHWNVLKQAFLATGLNNKILLTTRKRNVAEIGFPYELQLLNVDDGWELLKKKAFFQNHVPEFAVRKKKFQEIGKEIVRKCGYLPLGISLLGGILKTKVSLMEWELLNRNFNACLFNNSGGTEEDNEISRVLDLSYEDLPSYLKPCFLYLGHYREDESISFQNLQALWIAEGMISHENQGREQSLMDVAELYLNELVSRCIMQVEKHNGVYYCKLHDIVRELCLSKGKNEDFRLKALDYQEGKFFILNPAFLNTKTRYLAIYFGEQKDTKLINGFTSNFQEEIYNYNIRSLRFLRNKSHSSIEFPRDVIDFGKLKLLRVIVFENCIFEGGKLPREIGNLFCLKHLGLRYCALDELPISISNLTNLYTLDLVGTYDVRIPNVLNKMVRLKHLYFPEYNKEKLKHYRLRLEGLDELETLSGFNSLVHDLKSIFKMKNLRELVTIVHDNKTLSKIIDRINANLYVWMSRFIMVIEEGCECSTEEGLAVFKKVFTCYSLHFLFVMVPMKMLTIYDQSGIQIIFPSLVFLLLENSEIEEDPMEVLEKLPLLADLYLRNRSYVGEVMICHSMGFPKLKTLRFSDLPNLKEWRVEQGAMPTLNELKLHSCQRLEMIPYGLEFVTTLQNLHITKMPEFRKRVCAMLDNGEEGEDYYKVRHVPSILVN